MKRASDALLSALCALCLAQAASVNAQTAAISGTVSYSGRQTGNVWIIAATNSAMPTNLVGSTAAKAAVSPMVGAFTNISFTLTNLPTGTNYWLFAWRDSNTNSLNDATEAKAVFAANPILLTNNFTNAVLTLTDPDTNNNGIPDWWEQFYGIVFSWFGDGSDGPLVVSAGQTNFTDTVRAVVTGNNPAGSSVLSVATTNGFRPNDIVLIIAMQDPNTDLNQNIAGRYEFARLFSLSNDALVLASPLSNSFPATAGQRIQVLRVPQYSTVTVNGTLSCAAWDGTNGGVLAFLAQNLTLDSNGTIKADGKGFRGGISVPSVGDYEFGVPGEGTTGWSGSRATTSVAVAQGGGGAGKGADASGGGGGYESRGQDGSKWDSSSDFGRGGSPYGDTSLIRLYLGGGGGGSGSHNRGRVGVGGGTGGGIIAAICGEIRGNGVIACRGGQGSPGVYALDANCGAGGGGGAGGSIYLAGTLTNTLSISATGGAGGARASGSSGGVGGAGGNGRIRIDLAGGQLPSSIQPTVGYVGGRTNSLVPFVWGDPDSDGLRDDLEYQANTNPLNPDTDGDGLPDGWEVQYGLNPLNPGDAGLKPPGDQLSWLQKYCYGLNPLTPDTDGDGLSDYDELFVRATNPLNPDTDGDGMPDGWEVQYGLSPMLNDAALDRDLDGLTNLQEYQFNQTNTLGIVLHPTSRLSATNGLSDYENVTGRRNVTYFYDRNDRLTGAQYGNGLALLWQYDGNGNILRQLTATQDTSALPLVWRQLNNLTNTTGNQADYGDADGDGWSNYQEWQAGSNPRDAASTPDTLGLPGTNIALLTLPFTPSNFVVGVGQLDGTGAEEIVVGADGNPGTNTNFLLILSQSYSGWTTQRVDIGPFGITSIAVGHLTNRPSLGIYLGLRETGGTGRVAEVTLTGTNWTLNTIATSTNSAAFVLGLRSTNDLLVSLAATNAPAGALFSLGYGTNWSLGLVETNASQRGLGIIGATRMGETNLAGIRLMDAGGIRLGRVNLATNAVFYASTGKWYFTTTNRSSWTAAQTYARSIGGELATVTDATLNSFLLNQLVLNAPDQTCWIGLFRNSCCTPHPTCGWQWSSGTPFSYYTWAANEPNCSGGTERFAHMLNTGAWNDLPDNGNITAIIEMSPQAYDLVFALQVTLPEPAATSRLNWRGLSLCSGFPRASFTNLASVAYAYLDDLNGNGQIDEGDEFVLVEYQISSTNSPITTLLKRRMQGNGAASYGLAFVNYLNQTNTILFTGEPDGRVFSWQAAGATNALQSQVFSAHHAGKAWHALEGVQIPRQGEGLIGLRVNPASPNSCDVIFWPPQIDLWKPANVPETAPVARILPTPSSGGGFAPVNIRLWDGEGNASLLFLQYSNAASLGWSNAIIASVNGGAYGFVSAPPSGTTHQVIWNANGLFAPGSTNTVWLRARAKDSAFFGDWSPAVQYVVSIPADSDSDGLPDDWEMARLGTLAYGPNQDPDNDRFVNWQEYVADTDPLNGSSFLAITNMLVASDGLRIRWQGGVHATQFLQRSDNLSTNFWQTIFTSLPPTSVSGSYTDALSTNVFRFYRIKATR